MRLQFAKALGWPEASSTDVKRSKKEYTKAAFDLIN